MLRFAANLAKHPYTVPAARIAGHYMLALIAVLVPEVGENRFVVAGLLAFVFGPLGFLSTIKLDPQKQGSVEPFVDMLTVLVIVSFLPELWSYALIVGVIIALAPSIAIAKASYLLYAANSILLISGMSAIAIYNGVENWFISIGILLAVFPSTLLYAISLNHRTQQIRKKAEQLSALQLVAGGVAHDFNNILTGISGYADFAKTVSADSPSVQEALGKIQNATVKASQLTNQLIAFAGEKKTEFKPVDVCREVKSVTQMVEGLKPTEVDLSLKLPDAPVYVEGDTSQISQIVLNLAVNAVESISGPGQVDIAVEHDAGKVLIHVKDTGGGIDPALVSNLFEPFVSSKEKGHGLGLAVVKRIISDHKGQLELNGEPGQGTTFTVSLPDTSAPEVAPREKKSVVNQSVLIADDEQPIRAILRQLLENDGYQVFEAEDGTQFVEKFASVKDQLCAVMLDVKMPGKTGWECLEAVREERKDLPVMMISGFDPSGFTLKEPDPAMRFLAKPFRIAEVQALLQELLSTKA
jgi:signal transduction histidine kinase/ActR/RegA family two-component response regulator